MINSNGVKKYLKYLVTVPALMVPFFASAQNAVQSGLQGSGLMSMFGFGNGGLSSSQSLGELIGNAIKLFLTFIYKLSRRQFREKNKLFSNCFIRNLVRGCPQFLFQ